MSTLMTQLDVAFHTCPFKQEKFPASKDHIANCTIPESGYLTPCFKIAELVTYFI